MNKLRAFILRVIYKNQIIYLQKHPILKGKLFETITISNKAYYFVGDYQVLKK